MSVVISVEALNIWLIVRLGTLICCASADWVIRRARSSSRRVAPGGTA